MFVLMSIYPWNEITGASSPLVQIFASIGVSSAAQILNVVVITAAVSAINSDLFGAARMMYGLARHKHAPDALGLVSRTGVPVVPVIVMLAALLIGVLLHRLYPEGLFFIVAAMATFATVWVWLMILLSHWCMRRKMLKEEVRGLEFPVPWVARRAGCRHRLPCLHHRPARRQRGLAGPRSTVASCGSQGCRSSTGGSCGAGRFRSPPWPNSMGRPASEGRSDAKKPALRGVLRDGASSQSHDRRSSHVLVRCRRHRQCAARGARRMARFAAALARARAAASSLRARRWPTSSRRSRARCSRCAWARPTCARRARTSTSATRSTPRCTRCCARSRSSCATAPRHASRAPATTSPPQALAAPCATSPPRCRGIRRLLDSDVLAAYQGDPAARSVDEVLLCYPGILAMIHHRLAHRSVRPRPAAAGAHRRRAGACADRHRHPPGRADRRRLLHRPRHRRRDRRDRRDRRARAPLPGRHAGRQALPDRCRRPPAEGPAAPSGGRGRRRDLRRRHHPRPRHASARAPPSAATSGSPTTCRRARA